MASGQWLESFKFQVSSFAKSEKRTAKSEHGNQNLQTGYSDAALHHEHRQR